MPDDNMLNDIAATLADIVVVESLIRLRDRGIEPSDADRKRLVEIAADHVRDSNPFGPALRGALDIWRLDPAANVAVPLIAAAGNVATATVNQFLKERASDAS